MARSGKTAALLREHAPNLGEFLTKHPEGQRLPEFISKLADSLQGRQANVLEELRAVANHVDHIKQVVTMQQGYAKIVGLTEVLPLEEVVEDALRLNVAALERHGVQVVREYTPVPPVAIDRHKVLQILVNLVTNAKNALAEAKDGEKKIVLRIGRQESSISISVVDAGVGIPPENLKRIFEHGFTTRTDGHGFGLHSGALAAREMKGRLTGHSDGIGQGAVFTLELPIEANAAA